MTVKVSSQLTVDMSRVGAAAMAEANRSASGSWNTIANTEEESIIMSEELPIRRILKFLPRSWNREPAVTTLAWRFPVLVEQAAPGSTIELSPDSGDHEEHL
jgi:hypothetical protein